MNLSLLVAFLGCSTDVKNEEETALQSYPEISSYNFDTFVDWSEPINDVLEVGESVFGDDFNKNITELTPYEGRLWIGYGDANVNLGGEIPITFRSFSSANNPKVLIGEASGEEQFDRFRMLDGQLWMAGVDSIGTDEEVHFPLIGGNVYTLQNNKWSKHNTVPGGEHVHDVMSWDGAAWAVGSGANHRDEFTSGNIHRYLWRSQDNGQSWMIAHREPFGQDGNGDTRWVHLLPQQDDLYLFGYEYNFEAGVISVANARFDGWNIKKMTNSESLEDIFAMGTLPLTESIGLVWGVDVDEAQLLNEAWYVQNGDRTLLPALDGRSLIDSEYREDTGEILLLSYSGNEYGMESDSWDLAVHLLHVDNLERSETLIEWNDTERPTSIAFFQGSLFLGTTNGRVQRALGSQ